MRRIILAAAKKNQGVGKKPVHIGLALRLQVVVVVEQSGRVAVAGGFGAPQMEKLGPEPIPDRFDAAQYPLAIFIAGGGRGLMPVLAEITDQQVGDNGANVESHGAEKGEFRIYDFGFFGSFREDLALKVAVSRLKIAFLCHGEALLHGDLHTGSIMVTHNSMPSPSSWSSSGWCRRCGRGR